MIVNIIMMLYGVGSINSSEFSAHFVGSFNVTRTDLVPLYGYFWSVLFVAIYAKFEYHGEVNNYR